MAWLALPWAPYRAGSPTSCARAALHGFGHVRGATGQPLVAHHRLVAARARARAGRLAAPPTGWSDGQIKGRERKRGRPPAGRQICCFTPHEPTLLDWPHAPHATCPSPPMDCRCNGRPARAPGGPCLGQHQGWTVPLASTTGSCLPLLEVWPCSCDLSLPGPGHSSVLVPSAGGSPHAHIRK